MRVRRRAACPPLKETPEKLLFWLPARAAAALRIYSSGLQQPRPSYGVANNIDVLAVTHQCNSDKRISL